MTLETDAKPLQGQRVVFTGRLACLTRAEAAELVRAAGGRWSPTVTRHVSMLVIGQEGWPLRKDGRLTRKLLDIRRLRRIRPVEVVSEADLLDRLGLASEAGDIRQLSTAQLGEVLGVKGATIRAWVRVGLVQPVRTVSGVYYFDFRQVSWAKMLDGFARAGVSTDRLRRSLRQLTRWLPEAEDAIDQLRIVDRVGKLLVRLPDEGLAEATGQLTFDFEESGGPRAVKAGGGFRVPGSGEGKAGKTAEEWLAEGCRFEEAGKLEEAESAYRQALLVGGPDADACFDLANVLRAQGKREQAAERYYQAVEIEPGHADAWNNLGVLLVELGRPDEARRALTTAVELDPLSADARYNLADLLDDQGRVAEALPHWQAFLRQGGSGPWMDYARRRVKGMSRA